MAGRRTFDGRLQREGAGTLMRRVPNQASPTSTAISSQVVSTVAPMSIGPK